VTRSQTSGEEGIIQYLRMLEVNMPENVGAIDRAVRIILGVALLSLVFVGPKTLWGLVGIVPLLTGLARFCPAYLIWGGSTCARCDES
jgi:hypothetical protein